MTKKKILKIAIGGMLMALAIWSQIEVLPIVEFSGASLFTKMDNGYFWFLIYLLAVPMFLSCIFENEGWFMWEIIQCVLLTVPIALVGQPDIIEQYVEIVSVIFIPIVFVREFVYMIVALVIGTVLKLICVCFSTDYAWVNGFASFLGAIAAILVTFFKFAGCSGPLTWMGSLLSSDAPKEWNFSKESSVGDNSIIDNLVIGAAVISAAKRMDEIIAEQAENEE